MRALEPFRATGSTVVTATRSRTRSKVACEINTPNGPVRALLPPFTFTDEEAVMGNVPALGEHTDAVLRELGYTPAQIGALHTAGAV